MSRRRVVTRESELAAPASVVWRHATTMSEINRELSPLMRMTYPAEAAGQSLSSASVPLGEPLFVSWVLLFGLIPIERMSLRIVELGPEQRFVEESRLTLLSYWRHERSVGPAGSGSGCLVRDRLTLEPRLPGVSGLIAAFVGILFRHRHRRLKRLFGVASRP